MDVRHVCLLRPMLRNRPLYSGLFLLAAGIVAAVIAHAVLGTVEEEPSHSSKDRPPRS